MNQTDKLRELGRSTVNEYIITELCNLIDGQWRTIGNLETRIKALEEKAKKKD